MHQRGGEVSLRAVQTLSYINHFIRGVPYSRNKSRGDVKALERWREAVVHQTVGLPRVKDACLLNVTFLLPRNKFPSDYPYGSDLDNLLKLLFDALNETVFSEAKGKDSCVVSLSATKTGVGSNEEAGVHLEILPVTVS
jgi:Holliday junction resolvase RusA-like endonuclease